MKSIAWDDLFWMVVRQKLSLKIFPSLVKSQAIFNAALSHDNDIIWNLLWRYPYGKDIFVTDLNPGSGAVKTSGALAAVFAVDPRPSFFFLAVLFGALFLWEIGGQNIANDLTDVEEDRRMRARTIPICFGVERAILITGISLAAAMILTVVLFLISPLRSSAIFASVSLAATGYLLIEPFMGLARNQNRAAAMRLFNRASYYPPTMLLIVFLSVLI